MHLVHVPHRYWAEDPKKHGVYIAIDDYDDVLITGKGTGLYPEDLKPLVQALADTAWFRILIIRAAKRGVRVINMKFGNDGIRFE